MGKKEALSEGALSTLVTSGKTPKNLERVSRRH